MIVVRILLTLLNALAVALLLTKLLWGWFTNDDILAILVLIVAANIALLMVRRRLGKTSI